MVLFINMLLFKNSASTMEGVLSNLKHATDVKPRNVKSGDIILIAQTKKTLLRGQKSIRWVMNFVSIEEDVDNLSDKIWSRHWKYIINGNNLRSVEPFDIDDIKVTSTNYGAAEKFSIIRPEDEEKVLSFISEFVGDIDNDSFFQVVFSNEFKNGMTLDYDELIKNLDIKYRNTPEFKKVVTYLIRRPSALSDAIKRKYGFKCMICGYPGFLKKNGESYAEVHHMIELNKQAPETLQSWNLLVLCPLCHKKLHYADVNSEFLDPGWKIKIDSMEYIIK